MVKTEARVKSSLAKRSFQKFIKNKLAIVGAVGVTVIILLCICAPLLTEYDPSLIDPSSRSLSPCSAHPLGTDRLGRDLLARVLYGGRTSIMLGVAAAIGTNLLGAALGSIAGYYGGRIDRILVAIQEFFSIFPQMLLILLIVGFVGRSVGLLLAIWTLTGWGGMMRIVRGRIVSLKQEPFVESCRANGIGGLSIMFHHMIPNTLGPIIVNTTMNVAGYILGEAGLSYLGLGIPESIPSWGNIINAVKRLDIIQNEPLLWIVPGMAICLFVLSINFLGDGLRDALDPSSK